MPKENDEYHFNEKVRDRERFDRNEPYYRVEPGNKLDYRNLDELEDYENNNRQSDPYRD